MLLKDKKVLITGAGRGIGRQIAITMAEEGAVVLAAAHSEKNLRETASKIEAAGGACITKPLTLRIMMRRKRQWKSLQQRQVDWMWS